MLTALAEDLWAFEPPDPVANSGLPLRMTIVRLPDGGLWLHSPVALRDADAAAIEALGPVRHLVAPSRLHHLFAAPAAARWPEATLWLAPGLVAKRPDLTPHRLLSDDPPWAEAIRICPIEGAPSLDEHVFFHVATGTLLVTDLVFNVHRAASAFTPWLLRLTGTWDRFAQSRVWWFAIRDRGAAGRAARQLLGWPIRRVVPCHGDVVDDDAHAQLSAALQWMAAG